MVAKGKHILFLLCNIIYVLIYLLTNIIDIGEPVGNIRTVGDKVISMGFNKIAIPPSFSRHISWSLPDGSIRMWQGDKVRIFINF